MRLRVACVVFLIGCGAAPRAEVRGADDRDLDTIRDVEDRCPEDPEDRDVFEDDDGCPEPDNDRDAVLDVDDLCPIDPEDRDDFEDENGCPDPDDDRDVIVDACDRCPREPETYNGFADDDGCPDSGIRDLLDRRLLIVDTLRFRRGSSALDADARRLVSAVHITLRDAPAIERVLVVGVAHPRERDPEAIASARANAVRDALLAEGIDASRLEARGFGTGDPLPLEPPWLPRPPRPYVAFLITHAHGITQHEWNGERYTFTTEQPDPPGWRRPQEPLCPNGGRP